MCLGAILGTTSDSTLAQLAVALWDLVVEEVPDVVDELIHRGESATRMAIEVHIVAGRVLLPNGVVGR